MFLPVGLDEENPRLPKATLALIGINFFIYLFTSRLEGGGLEALYAFFGLVPARVLAPDLILWYKTFPFLTAMFIHGGFLHVAGNCLFLYLFGCPLENRFGPRKLVYFYLASGLYAGLFYVCCQWQDPLPVIGASGAVCGLMGAVLLLMPLARLRLLWLWITPFYSSIVVVPAYAFLGLYFLAQLALGLLDVETGVAYWGHVGGFVGGLALSHLILTGALRQPLKRRRGILLVGRNRARPETPRVTTFEQVKATLAGFATTRTLRRVGVALAAFYVLLLGNFYILGLTGRQSVAAAFLEFFVVIMPVVYFVYLALKVNSGASWLVNAILSPLIEAPGDFEVRPELFRAEALERKGDYLGAVKVYRKIFGRFPDRIDLLYRVAEIYRNKLGDTRKAAGAYRALTGHPEQGRYAYLVRHARELLPALERGEPERTGAIRVEAGDDGEDFVVERF